MHGAYSYVRPGFHYDKRTRVGLLSNASRASYLPAFHPAWNRCYRPDPLGLDRPATNPETKPDEHRKSREHGRERQMNLRSYSEFLLRYPLVSFRSGYAGNNRRNCQAI